MSMYFKTEKPIADSGGQSGRDAILDYIENLKEEISFNLERLSAKIDILKNDIQKTNGGAT